MERRSRHHSRCPHFAHQLIQFCRRPSKGFAVECYPFGEQMPGTSPLMNQTGSADTRYKFTGKEEDPETALYYFGARYYDPWSGRFGQPDLLDFLSPDKSSYEYSFNNPIRFSDPSGLDAGPSVEEIEYQEAAGLQAAEEQAKGKDKRTRDDPGYLPNDERPHGIVNLVGPTANSTSSQFANLFGISYSPEGIQLHLGHGIDLPPIDEPIVS